MRGREEGVGKKVGREESGRKGGWEGASPL